MEFQEILRIYSLDVILIAAIVCAVMAILRRYCKAFYERVGQYLPFFLAVGLYLIYDLAVNHFDALEAAISKGLQCAVCSVLLKTAFEEWICKEKKVSLPKDRTLFAAMGVLSTVTDLAHAKELAKSFTSALEALKLESPQADFNELCLEALERVLPAAGDEKLIELASALAGTLRTLEDSSVDKK